MARLSAKEQFKRYEQAREIYVAKRSIYSYLDGGEQPALHAFYQPHKDHLSESLKVHQ